MTSCPAVTMTSRPQASAVCSRGPQATEAAVVLAGGARREPDVAAIGVVAVRREPRLDRLRLDAPIGAARRAELRVVRIGALLQRATSAGPRARPAVGRDKTLECAVPAAG